MQKELLEKDVISLKFFLPGRHLNITVLMWTYTLSVFPLEPFWIATSFAFAYCFLIGVIATFSLLFLLATFVCNSACIMISFALLNI